VRGGVAKLLQVLILVGLVAAWFRRGRAGFAATEEFLLLGLGSIMVVALLVVVPVLSVNYGVLRAFQQCLFVLAPFIVVGGLTIFRPLRRAAPVVTAAIAVGMFLSTSGAFPELTGGYPAQLNLNNSGLYYDIYYVHPQEVAGIDWVGGQSPTSGVQVEVQADRYARGRLQTFTESTTVNDIFPSLVRRSAYVFLGFSTVKQGTSTISFEGDLVTYRYPVGFLLSVKSLVYDNGGSRVFR